MWNIDSVKNISQINGRETPQTHKNFRPYIFVDSNIRIALACMSPHLPFMKNRKILVSNFLFVYVLAQLLSQGFQALRKMMKIMDKFMDTMSNGGNNTYIAE